ncbi:MAG: hypothetical protein ACTHNP_02170 [Solirubrobacterales bacterium]
METAASVTQEAVRALVSHPTELRDLVYGVEERSDLLGMSETLRLDDKIVLYEALEDRGFRLRLHVSKNLSREVPHNHRFPVTAFILRGVYYHKLYVCDVPLDEAVSVSNMKPVFVRDERAGACYTMPDDTIESNMTAHGTMSLLMRGPTAKERALGIDRESGKVFWKYGQKNESPEQLAKVRMSPDYYRALRDRIAAVMGWDPPVMSSTAGGASATTAAG